MPIKLIICDDCEKETTVFLEDCNGRYFCKTCTLKHDAHQAERDYQGKKKWLEETHLKELESLRVRAEELMDFYIKTRTDEARIESQGTH